MALNIAYEEYIALFPDGLNQDEFAVLLPEAVAFVDVMTANRAGAATGYKEERVKQAVCAVIRELSVQNCARGAGGARVTSVSNDGYSENYGSLNTVASEESALRSVAFRYLSGTGLVSAL